jgi:hypothetical protein
MLSKLSKVAEEYNVNLIPTNLSFSHTLSDCCFVDEPSSMSVFILLGDIGADTAQS